MRPLPGAIVEDDDSIIVANPPDRCAPQLPQTVPDYLESDALLQEPAKLLISVVKQQEQLKEMITHNHDEMLALLKHPTGENIRLFRKVSPGQGYANKRRSTHLSRRSDRLSISSLNPAKPMTGINSVFATKRVAEVGSENVLAQLRGKTLQFKDTGGGFNGESNCTRRTLTKSSTSEMQHSSSRKLRRDCLEVINHRFFEVATAVLILLNAACFAAHLDYSVKNVHVDETPIFFKVAQSFFIVAFTLEICMRAYAEGSFFFGKKNPGLGWNIFDLFLVFMSWVEEIFSSIESLPSVLAIRVLRVLRIIRVLRAFRVLRFFRDLRVMVRGIYSSLKSLVWAMLLLLLVMFTYGLCIMHFVCEELRMVDTLTPTVKEQLLDYYGSFDQTLFTLFKAISGGDDWNDFAEPLGHISVTLQLLFVSYVVFSTFCVLNIVTGVFVENATKITAADEDDLLVSEIEARAQHIEEIKKVFLSHDKDNSSELDWEEFQEHMNDVRVKFAMRRLGLDLDTISLPKLFRMLDFDQSGSIDMDEFILGIQMFHGEARSIDVAKVRYELGMIRLMMAELLGGVHIPEDGVAPPSFGPGGSLGFKPEAAPLKADEACDC